MTIARMLDFFASDSLDRKLERKTEKVNNVFFTPYFRHHYEKLPWTLVPMHPVSDDLIAAPIDPGIPQRSFTEKDFEGDPL